ncbi:MAG: hypothetical protein HUU22_11670 [Phycisphaerae bacterium]|nr:hypothetical protein [Phycisphaerae bacterium]NUQ46680.1 hypothetical protein [Phycisphaerae bacterium]
MKIPGFAMCVIASLAVAAAAQPTSEPSRRIVVTGRAEGVTPAAAEEARLDALRVAVQNVCGSFINAQSEIEEFALVRDKVLEQPVGFARVVKVVRGPEAMEGFTQITLEAEVFPAIFERRWAEFAHIKQREGNPRMVLIVVEDDDPTDLNPPVVNGIAQRELEDFFLKHDVRLMDKDISDEVRRRDLELAARSGDDSKAAAAGAAFKADVVVVGQVEVRQGSSVFLEGREIKRWDAPLSIRVIQTDSGAVLVSRNYAAADVRSTALGTARDALIAVARQRAPDILSDIGEAWRKRATAGRTIQVTFEPCTRSRFKALQAAMIAHKGVTGGADGFALRELENQVAAVEVNWKYDLSQLADRLEELSVAFEGGVLRCEIAGQSANRLTVRLRVEPASPTSGPAASEPTAP